jgi:hypothetical protein
MATYIIIIIIIIIWLPWNNIKIIVTWSWSCLSEIMLCWSRKIRGLVSTSADTKFRVPTAHNFAFSILCACSLTCSNSSFTNFCTYKIDKKIRVTKHTTKQASSYKKFGLQMSKFAIRKLGQMKIN